MPEDTKTLGNNKARACESLGFVHKKGCASVLTQPLCRVYLSFNKSGRNRAVRSCDCCNRHSSILR